MMAVLVAVCALGLPVGFLQLWKVRLCRGSGADGTGAVSVVIPARNEEHNLPRLLESLRAGRRGLREVIVVDDSSVDGTATAARAAGATVIASRSLPAGWTGKNWACWQGAEAATGDAFLFLDADTWFAPEGLGGVLSAYSALAREPVAISVLPFHVMREPYEQLSLFFNLMMAFGAGGFGLWGEEKLFGQSLVIGRPLYRRIEGHAAVAGNILEHVAMSKNVKAWGGRCVCMGGRGALNMRMFPEGFGQLYEGWTKAFSRGAAETDGVVLGMAVYWLSALCLTLLLVLLSTGMWRLLFAAVYVSFALQTFWIARQLGTFRLLTCLLYPLALGFFFALFAVSFWLRFSKRKVRWRGRQL